MGKYDIPFIKNDPVSLEGLELIGYHNAKCDDPYAGSRLVHGFKDDYRINSAYNFPEKSFNRLKNYACLCTPNYSFFSNMPIALQINAVFKSRWVGAFWQSKGKQVVANVSWGTPDSYDFAFEGIEEGSTVIISTMGAKRTKDAFLYGYEEMIKRIAPSNIWCYCTPFPEIMDSVAHVFPYEVKKKTQSSLITHNPSQISIFDLLEQENGDEYDNTRGTLWRVS